MNSGTFRLLECLPEPDMERSELPARHLADPQPSDFGRSPGLKWLSLGCHWKMPPPAAHCGGGGEEEDEDDSWRWLLLLLLSAPLPILCTASRLTEWVGRRA